MPIETLKAEALQLDIEISDAQLDMFSIYSGLLLGWNEKINLTSITEPHEVAIKHFLDSLLLLKDIDFTSIKSIIDVGTGAGFPGLPLKILMPHLELTLLDSLQKRCIFLEEVKIQLGLTNVVIIHNRAEIAALLKDQREQYDLATARAVANLSVLSEYCIPFVKTGGYFIAPKGKDGVIEAEQAQNALKLLGARVEKINTYQLPNEAGKRVNIIIKKDSPTPSKYPRRTGLPEKKPL